MHPLHRSTSVLPTHFSSCSSDLSLKPHKNPTKSNHLFRKFKCFRPDQRSPTAKQKKVVIDMWRSSIYQMIQVQTPGAPSTNEGIPSWDKIPSIQKRMASGGSGGETASCSMGNSTTTMQSSPHKLWRDRWKWFRMWFPRIWIKAVFSSWFCLI